MEVERIACGPVASEKIAFHQVATDLRQTSGDGHWLLLTNLDFSAEDYHHAD